MVTKLRPLVSKQKQNLKFTETCFFGQWPPSAYNFCLLWFMNIVSYSRENYNYQPISSNQDLYKAFGTESKNLNSKH